MAFQTRTDRELDRLQPPQSLDAEQAVLGAILKDPDALNRAVEILDNETHFYFPKHQAIYHSALELYARSEPCDITTIANALLRDGELEKAGGRVYLVDLVEGVASTAHIASYANIVLEKSLLRRLISTTTEIARSCYNLEQPVDTLLDEAEASIFNISESRLRQAFVPLKQLINDSVSQIESFQSGEAEFEGIKTGFGELDAMTQGLHNGDFVVVAGRPSMGKSALAVNIAEHVSINLKKPVAIFSVEMSKEQLALRMLCGRSGISQHTLRSRKLSHEQWMHLTRAANLLAPANIYIDDSATLTSLEMRAKSRRLKQQHNDLALIIVDYLQMMHASGRAENRQQEISVISRNLKVLAKELAVPVLGVSQLSRAVEQRGGEKRPQLADLRESGAIEQDADLVLFVYRPEAYLSEDDKRDPKNQDKLGRAEIIVAKQRNGPTGSVNLTFRKELARFENPEFRRDLPPGVEPVGPDVPF
ncbi:MAG: replicative DNA helicase [Candidatus Zixiibacteriota bacterium]